MNIQPYGSTRPPRPGAWRPTRIAVAGAALAAALALAAFSAACGGSNTSQDATPAAAVIDPGDGGNYKPALDPSKFVARVTHPYMPLAPGSRWVYESTDGKERIEIEVLAETRTVIGIAATVVHDVVFEDGRLVEDTFDWYAQDTDGNVWYLGEASKEIEDGKVVSTHGSWEAGVDGASPGIQMLAAPALDRAYRQEYYKGEAEDLAKVRKVDGTAAVRAGTFTAVLVIAEWTPLEPAVVEDKYYARGVGMVAGEKVQGATGRIELVSFQAGK